ncbi:MAG: helix-turn-helix domain-containing protein [Actinomycetota bacterium]|nr:helix-turn-helix domain-containing protein [Actinomycetota bacterium]
MEQLLRAAKVAELLDVSERYVYQLASEGKIPCVRVARSVRFRPSDIDAWLEGQVRASAAVRGLMLSGRERRGAHA